MAGVTDSVITVTFDDETKDLLRSLARLLAARDRQESADGKRRLTEPVKDRSFGDV